MVCVFIVYVFVVHLKQLKGESSFSQLSQWVKALDEALSSHFKTSPFQSCSALLQLQVCLHQEKDSKSILENDKVE